MRRSLLAPGAARAGLLLVAASLLAALLLWLTSPALLPVDLGPAQQIVGRPGVGRLLLSGPEGWRVQEAAATVPGAVLPLPSGVLGRPALASDGSVLALIGERLVVLGTDGVAGRGPELPPRELGGDWQLVGVDAADHPVLSCATDGGRRLLVVEDESGSWLELASQGRHASPPARAKVLLSRARRALAYRGAECWEAWLFDEKPVRHVQAPGCAGGSAVFSPEGEALILDGKTDGIYRLELDSGRVTFMAKGNLGHSRRVPFSAGFRGDPLLMVAPVRDSEGHLQIVQTHLRGGGRYGISTGAVHHYGVATSQDGRYLAYCQASFDEAGDGTIPEALYLFDFDIGRAVFSVERVGGRSGCGPLFVGEGPILVYVADGRAQWLDPRID